MKKYIQSISMLFLLALTAVSCKDDQAVTPAAEVTPNKAFAGTLLTIKGSNLKNIQKVLFGTVETPFNPAYNTDGAMLLRVPTNAIYGDQKLTLFNAGGEKTQLQLDFTVLQPPPAINSFEPSSALPGDKVTINGNNFIGQMTVDIEGVPVKILSSDKNKIVIEIPKDAKQGKINVTTGGGKAESLQVLYTEKVILLVSDFDGNGIRADGNFWYAYGDTDQDGKSPVTTNKSPDPIKGNFLKATNSTGKSGKGYVGFSTWDWDNWKGFGLKDDISKVGIRFDLNSNGATKTDMFVAFDDFNGGNWKANVKVDWVGWKTVTVKLSDLSIWYGTTQAKPKIGDLKRFIFGFDNYKDINSEVNLDNVRFVEVN
jgi:hypothetical protein